MVMRLNQAVQRWDDGMANVELMETKWEDAFHTVIRPLISNARTGEKAKEISKSQIPIFPNFLGLVLGCIEAKFCK